MIKITEITEFLDRKTVIDFLDKSVICEAEFAKSFKREGLILCFGGGVMALNTIFPPCPKCEEGSLLPFSRGEDIFEIWRCSHCLYTIYKR